jgi:hypothetical protein
MVYWKNLLYSFCPVGLFVAGILFVLSGIISYFLTNFLLMKKDTSKTYPFVIGRTISLTGSTV